ncbi:hypothetical protein C2845_PM08G09060 [Panicum miliaceum]|uniref:Uncharacterized protein n=1 Tax=Panicum miliaceum TaxID=4540 RepID=A0A3L6R301_PANMI|nr:hypothetical protein C2845_PM08G09060 [Panicum miliaceum]
MGCIEEGTMSAGARGGGRRGGPAAVWREEAGAGSDTGGKEAAHGSSRGRGLVQAEEMRCWEDEGGGGVPLAGRIATNPRSGLPEVRCDNQGSELMVGESGVALASLDYGTMSESLRRIQVPYADDVALSVQVVSFACGGFTVAWRTNHVLVDGSALSLLVTSWSEVVRSATLSAAARPNHDRSVFRPRSPRR